MPNDQLFFFEQTDFSLRFARCTISETSLHIEDLKEVHVADATALSQLAPAGTPVVCALRPKPRQLHLATAEEAKRYIGLTGLQQFAQLPLFAKGEPAWFAGVQASDGTAPSNTAWLMSLSSAAAQQQARTVFEAIKLKPARCLDGTLATCGALSSIVTGPTLLLEIGELGSHALMIGSQGVVAARAISLNLDQIAEAVQNELGLKFRGSAAKLFFNPDCDFSESGPKIAGRLATTLKADLVPLLAGQTAPIMLSCAGLPALQNWLEIQLAAALGLTPHAPDIKAWSTTVGVTFNSSALASSVSPAWFNFLHFINSQTLESTGVVPWQAEWLSLKAPIAAPVARAVAANPPAAPVAAKPPEPTPAPAPTPVTPSAPAAAPTPTPAKTAPIAPSKAAPVAAQSKTIAANQAKPAPAAPAAKQAVTPAPAKAAVSSVQYSSKPTAQTKSEASPKKSANKMLLFIGIGVVILALLGGGYFYLEGQKEEAARLVVEKQKTEQRIKAEEERAHLAEQKEAEDRKKFELETSQKLAAAEAARQQAEAEARAQTATRLANARGTLVVNTRPAGATVTVGDLPAKTSPATFTFIKIGKYPVRIALAHHEETKLELEVTENNTTDSGVIQLASLVGSATITSEPAGSSYELHPVNAFSISGDAKRTGQTPATVENLDPGDYSVTFSRPGWAPHTETISVARNATATATWNFPSGLVKITSSPTGATVSHDGVRLGVTPLAIAQAPGKNQYELKLAFHDPVVLPAVVEEGKTIELTAQLPLTDIIYGPGDLDKTPEPINPKTPDLPASLTLVEGRVVIQMTINRDGTTTDLKLVRASNAEIGKLYMAAVAKWKFKPGMKDGKPVRSAVVAPFLINPSKD